MKATIRRKVLVAITILLLVALGITDLVWFIMIRPILTTQLQESQQQIGFRARDRVEEFIDAKIRGLIVHSQSAAFLTQNADLERLELIILLTQDKDIETIALLDIQGKEHLRLLRTGAIHTEVTDRSQSPSYLTTTSRYAKEYISDVRYVDNAPQLTIAVPISIPVTRQRLTDLSTEGQGATRRIGEILGVLEVVVRLDTLFEELTVLGTQQTGNVYVADRNGFVIAHSNTSFTNGNINFQHYPPIRQYMTILNDPNAESRGITQTKPLMEYTNEDNQQVLGTFVTVPKTGWAVVIQQPSSLALADLRKVTVFALFILFGGLLISAPITYFFMRKFTDPIRQLVVGAHNYGEGNLQYRVNIRTGDELSELGDAFTQMAINLDSSRLKLEQDKAIISGERNKLEVILSGMYDAVIAVDPDRRIILINTIAEELIGYTKSEAINQPIETLITLRDKDELIPPDTYCPTGLNTSEGVLWNKKNITMVGKNNSESYINIVVSQIEDGNTVGVGCIVTIHDITKEVKFEKMKLDFVSMAAHELRTPLTAIRGYADMLIDQAKQELTEDQFTQLLAINDSSEKLAGLIDNLLNVSKIERGTFTVVRDTLDLLVVAAECVQEIRQQAENKQLHLVFEKPTFDHAWVLADRIRISEVFANLLENAVNYTTPGGSIILSVREDTTTYRVTIADTGHGIPKDSLPHLFTKFYRVSGGLEQGSKGTGLGLYVSKSIIDMHQGTIWVESELGKGTTFSFSLAKATTAEIERVKSEQSSQDRHRLSAPGIIRNKNRLP